MSGYFSEIHATGLPLVLSCPEAIEGAVADVAALVAWCEALDQPRITIRRMFGADHPRWPNTAGLQVAGLLDGTRVRVWAQSLHHVELLPEERWVERQISLDQLRGSVPV